LWNNSKYWSKFGEMLDIGLPVEDSHEMAKEYMQSIQHPPRHGTPHNLSGDLDLMTPQEVVGASSSSSIMMMDTNNSGTPPTEVIHVGTCPVCGKDNIPMSQLQKHVYDCLQ
ncbi:hypothetical protein FOL47_007533, partial [Perkinsus chesapeaki]